MFLKIDEGFFLYITLPQPAEPEPIKLTAQL